MTFVQVASSFTSTVRVRRVDGDEWIDGKSIMQMLLLAGTMGTTIEVECDGSDQDQAIAGILDLILRKFDED